MEAQSVLQKLLQKRFFELQTKNPSFSMRAYAKKLGMAPSATSEILRGQRKASRKLAERVAKKLLLDPQETQELLKHFPTPKKLNQAAPQDSTGPDYLKLTADQFQLISDWAHYAILSLIKTAGFQSKPEWIADRLGITVSKVENCLERLERLEIIARDEAGDWKRLYTKINTPDDVFNLSLQKAHLGDMEIAKEALLNIPVEHRDFTSISMPTALDLLPQAKTAIRKFKDEIAEILESKPGTEVYQMSIYLYPLTQIKHVQNQGEQK